MSDGERSSTLTPKTPIGHRVALLMALHACLVLVLRTAEGSALSLFLGHLGAEHLPQTFLTVSLIDVPLTLLYLAVARRLSTRRLLSGLVIALVVLLGASLLLAQVHRGAGLFAAYVATTTLSTFIVIQWGVTLLELFTVDESLRAFPAIYAGAQVGGLGAGIALRELSAPLGTETLLIVIPAAAGVVVLLLLGVVGKLREGQGWRRDDCSARAREGRRPSLSNLRFLRTNPLLRAIAVATAIMVGLRLALRFTYGAGFEAAFPDPDDLTRFLGTYTIIASIAILVVQLLITPSLLRWFGAALVNVIYAYLVGLALLVGSIWPGLVSAVIGRCTDRELKVAIKTPVSPMFYEALGDGHRKASRALILGVVSPIASLCASLLLIVVVQVGVDVVWVAAAGGLLSVGYVVAAHLQGRAYRRALEAEVLEWHQRACEESEQSERNNLSAALTAAKGCRDQRIEDMAREVRRRMKGRE